MLQELCRSHYKEEAKRIKKEFLGKGNLPKNTQQILLVRHQFKIAYYAEFRKDNRTSLKYLTFSSKLISRYYILAYNHLRELAMSEMKNGSPLKIREIKAVADCINFLVLMILWQCSHSVKICKLYLSISNIAEAISQFQKHSRTYKPCIGATELEFEHWAWMSKQWVIHKPS